MKRLWIVLMPLLLLSSAAAEEKIKVGEVVVTATRIEELAGETTSDVTIVTAKEMQEKNLDFVSDVLKTVPEINVVQNGSDGKFSSVFLRGGAPTQTLIMVDGIKVNSTTTGSFDFSSLMVNGIERIEIVKGPQSTVYGSEAMAGVINIITKRGEGKPQADLSFEAGSYGTYKPAVTFSGSSGIFNYRLTGLYLSTSGISVAKSGSEKDGYTNANISWKFGVNPSKNSEIEITGGYGYTRSELDDFDIITRKAVDALNFVQSGHNFLLGARGRLYLFDTWEQLLTLSTFRESLTFKDPTTAYNNAEIINKRQTVDWQHNLYLSDAVTLTGGLEYRKEEGENVGNFDDSVDNIGLYLLSKVKLLGDSLILNGGLRYDDHETAGSKTTYRIGALYMIKGADLSIRGSYATGFRAPSLNDLFFPFYGNPTLKPEETKSYDIGVVKTFLKERVSLSLTYFDQKYDNLIDFDPLTFTAANIDKARVKGVEVGASYKITDAVLVRAGYTYLDTKDETTGNELTRRPKNKVTAGIAYAANNLSLSADYIYVGERFNSASLDTLDPYSLVNLSGSYRLTKNLTAFARIENLFDEDYEDVSGFGTKGISVYGGIRASF